MRIDLNAKMPELPESKPLNRPGPSNRSSDPGASRSADEATLAGHTRAQELQTQLQQMPEDRQARVEALARAIREGQYNVGPEQIAQSLFSDMAARSVLTR
ncbi:MAG: flagellar biosynthesis anti-sigma factor FlgM [Terriglobales bacterium]